MPTKVDEMMPRIKEVAKEKAREKGVKEEVKYEDCKIYTEEELKNYTDEDIKAFKCKHDIPDVLELVKGPWPSFAADAIREAVHRSKLPKDKMLMASDCVEDLLGTLQLSYIDLETHWKHGGIVGVFGYGGGVIGRYNDQQERFPGIWAFHTLRINQPASKFYTTEWLRSMCDIWEYRGSGLMNLHGSTGDIVCLGTVTDQLEPMFFDLTYDLGQDLGGSGSNLRTPSACMGKALCEYAMFDTQEMCYELTMHYQDELHRPAFPYKFKFKFDGCPNCCVASIARSDMAYIGRWRDDIRIDQEAVKAYVAGELKPNAGAHAGRDWGKFDIQKEVIERCPAHCMEYDGVLKIDNKECVRCMHCINTMPRALRVGTDTGFSLCFGAKAPILEGAQMGVLTIPFMQSDYPYDNVKDLVDKVWDWWMEEGKNRERLGELIQRFGLPKFLEVIGVPPMPQMVWEPRSNPYVFWKESDVPGGWERDIKEFRKKHPR